MTGREAADKTWYQSKKFLFALIAMCLVVATGAGSLLTLAVRPDLDPVGIAAVISAIGAPIVTLAGAYVGFVANHDAKIRTST